MTMQWNVPLPVNDRNQGEIARAQLELEQAQSRVSATERDIRNDITTADAQYRTTVGLLRTIETDMLPRARQARDIIDYSYRRGEATLVELLDAQRAFTDTTMAQLETQAAVARARFLLNNLTASGTR
jgi:cobalt-zinc-cadmium efflux system outer membrane protein